MGQMHQICLLKFTVGRDRSIAPDFALNQQDT